MVVVVVVDYVVICWLVFVACWLLSYSRRFLFTFTADTVKRVLSSNFTTLHAINIPRYWLLFFRPLLFFILICILFYFSNSFGESSCYTTYYSYVRVFFQLLVRLRYRIFSWQILLRTVWLFLKKTSIFSLLLSVCVRVLSECRRAYKSELMVLMYQFNGHLTPRMY